MNKYPIVQCYECGLKSHPIGLCPHRMCDAWCCRRCMRGHIDMHRFIDDNFVRSFLDDVVDWMDSNTDEPFNPNTGRRLGD